MTMSPPTEDEVRRQEKYNLIIKLLKDMPATDLFRLFFKLVLLDMEYNIKNNILARLGIEFFKNSRCLIQSIMAAAPEKEKQDRITSLPDSLLLEIISRLELSTKEVIKTTSTISKRWQHLWTQLPTLLFIDKDDVPHLSYNTDLTHYFSFIDKTLTQCPTNLNLNKFKLKITNNSQLPYKRPTSQVNSWVRHAITLNVQEVHLRIRTMKMFATLDDELIFNNSCLMSMKLSCCVFNPPNGAIRWDKLKFLCIDYGHLDENLIGKILSGSPCLETLEFHSCGIAGRFSKSLFGNFGVERLSCDMETYNWFTYGDGLNRNNIGSMSMKLSRCVSNPPNGWDNLKFLCIDVGELIDEDSIGKILTGSPCLETLELKNCFGVRRIDIASKSVKNLVLYSLEEEYTYTIEINAPYILSLTIKGNLFVEKILLLNVSFLVKADLNFSVPRYYFEERLGRDRGDIEEELLRGLLSSLGHVNKVALGDCNCLQVLSRLKKRGFQFPKSSDVTSRGRYSLQPRSFLLIIILCFVFWVTMVSKPCGRIGKCIKLLYAFY